MQTTWTFHITLGSYRGMSLCSGEQRGPTKTKDHRPTHLLQTIVEWNDASGAKAKPQLAQQLSLGGYGVMKSAVTSSTSMK